MSTFSQRRRRPIDEAIAAHGPHCYYCGLTFSDRNGHPTVDHLTPTALGGRNVATNRVPACLPCNRAKGATRSLEFEASGWLEERRRQITNKGDPQCGPITT